MDALTKIKVEQSSVMKKSLLELLWMKLGVFTFVSTLCVTSLMAGEPDPAPPDQDYYLHFSQYPNFCCGGDALTNGSHELVTLNMGRGPIK